MLAVTAIVVPFGGGWLMGALGVVVSDVAAALFVLGTLLWLLAALSQMTRPSSTLTIGVGVSVVAYAVSFGLPSASMDGRYLGWEAFWNALFWVTDVWLANPAYLLGIIAARRGNGGTAFALSALALALALMHLDIARSHPAIIAGSSTIVVLPG